MFFFLKQCSICWDKFEFLSELKIFKLLYFFILFLLTESTFSNRFIITFRNSWNEKQAQFLQQIRKNVFGKSYLLVGMEINLTFVVNNNETITMQYFKK